jgi:hypothetical protein
MRIVNARFLLVALLLFAHGAYAAGGRYERTKDGKARVWNISPKPGEAAAWSGDRDADGYATGYGTITWYKAHRKMLTGFNLPPVQYVPFVRYSGKMVRGKLEGPVETADPAGGKKFHAKFADGAKVGRWVAGPGPGPDKRRDEPVLRAELVEAAPAPAEPPPAPVTNQPAAQEVATPAVAETEKKVSESAVKAPSSQGMDDSLRELVGPPPLLRAKADGASKTAATSTSTSSSQSGNPRLTPAEAIELADAEARTQGYDLGEYQRPQARYVAAGDSWSVVYDQKSLDSATEIGKPFSVSVEDKTKKASVAAAR